MIKNTLGIGIYHTPVTKDYVNGLSDMTYEEPFRTSKANIWACENWRHIPTGLLLVHRTKGTSVPTSYFSGMCNEWFLMSDGGLACAGVLSIGKLHDYLTGRDQFFIKNDLA